MDDPFARRNPPPDPAPAVTLISRPGLWNNTWQPLWWVIGKMPVGPFQTRQDALQYLAHCSYHSFRQGLDDTRTRA